MKCFETILLTVTLIVLSNAYKILVVFPIPGRSHAILGQGYVELLLKAGHEVCMTNVTTEEVFFSVCVRYTCFSILVYTL